MITFLTSPKPFINDIAEIQGKAIKSWQIINPDVEIIVYGDGEGVSEACTKMKVKHVCNIETTGSGIPYFNAIVEHAKNHAKYDIQCYLNCDIILANNLIKSIKDVKLKQFLIIGQRIDLEKGNLIKINSNHLEVDLNLLIENKKAHIHPPTGIDYFIFPKGIWGGLKPLIIGRGGYDNALLAFCIQQNIPIIDATERITAIHQFHDYQSTNNSGKKFVHEGIEAIENKKIHKVSHGAPIISDANYRLEKGKETLFKVKNDWLRNLELYLRFKKKKYLMSYFIRFIWRIIHIS